MPTSVIVFVQAIQAKVQELITSALAVAADGSQPMMPVSLLGVCCSLHILQVSCLLL